MIPWTVGHQAPLSMEFSRQEYWSPGDLSNSGIEPVFPTLTGGIFTTEPRKAPAVNYLYVIFLLNNLKKEKKTKIKIKHKTLKIQTINSALNFRLLRTSFKNIILDFPG